MESLWPRIVFSYGGIGLRGKNRILMSEKILKSDKNIPNVIYTIVSVSAFFSLDFLRFTPFCVQ